MKSPFFLLFILLLGGALRGGSPIPHAMSQWPMASGPHGTWVTTTEDEIPVRWSVSNDSNILWKRVLPEGGQSGIAIWNDRVFFTTNKPLREDTSLEEAEGSDIIGYSLNAENGNVEWTVDIPSPKTMPYSGLFSDNSSATPITDGKHVWFINQGGLMLCLDMNGKEVWRRSFESRTRHNAKQCEPILVNDQLLFVAMRDSDDPLRRLMRAKPGARNTAPELWPWTFIRSFDAGTGKALWTGESGTSVHNTPRMGFIDGEAVIFHARGGGHRPPEIPYGFSMSRVSGKEAGRELWSYQSNRAVTYTVSHFDKSFAFGIDSGSLIKLDARSGEVVRDFPLFEKADIHLWNAITKQYEKHLDASFSIVAQKFKKEPTNQTPILMGHYYLFMTHEGHCIGRVNTESGKVEYLQVPVQVVRKQGVADRVLWDQHISSDGTNSRGMKTANDKRSRRDGWGHVTAGSPIAVNEFVFFSTMIGMTYVIDSQKSVFDESALISVNDLGLAGRTWSLSTPSYSQGKIFHRGLKQIVCIGSKKERNSGQ